jgi:hypothetical protein
MRWKHNSFRIERVESDSFATIFCNAAERQSPSNLRRNAELLIEVAEVLEADQPAAIPVEVVAATVGQGSL